ncbi:MAG: LacI family DNA-binding transcriptional regulator [Anaerolineae bacterium]
MDFENKDRVITQKDVAKMAGVSPSVVSYVINNGPRPVSEDARRRVVDAINRLEYTPNRFAQQLMRDKWQSQDRNQFAVVMGGGANNLQRPFYASILNGIFDEARETDRRVLSIQFLTDLLDPVLFNTFANSREIFGIVLIAINSFYVSEEEQDVLDRIIGRFDNVISIERKLKDLPAVTLDLQEAGSIATQHLINLGHSKIAYIGTRDPRFTGYQLSLLNAGIPQNEALQLVIRPAILNYQVGYESAAKLMESSEHVTAIFAASDEVAIGALRYFQAHNISVPGDVALVGVDNIEQSAYTFPALTTVQIPKVELGKHSVRMLIDRSTRPDSPAISHVMPAELIVRESCGANQVKR